MAPVPVLTCTSQHTPKNIGLNLSFASQSSAGLRWRVEYRSTFSSTAKPWQKATVIRFSSTALRKTIPSLRRIRLVNLSGVSSVHSSQDTRLSVYLKEAAKLPTSQELCQEFPLVKIRGRDPPRTRSSQRYRTRSYCILKYTKYRGKQSTTVHGRGLP